jgi:hypothetical protein
MTTTTPRDECSLDSRPPPARSTARRIHRRPKRATARTAAAHGGVECGGPCGHRCSPAGGHYRRGARRPGLGSPLRSPSRCRRLRRWLTGIAELTSLERPQSSPTPRRYLSARLAAAAPRIGRLVVYGARASVRTACRLAPIGPSVSRSAQCRNAERFDRFALLDSTRPQRDRSGTTPSAYTQSAPEPAPRRP